MQDARRRRIHQARSRRRLLLERLETRLPLAVEAVSLVHPTFGNETGNGYSHIPQRNAMSADGRYIVFESHASNLVTTDTNNAQDVFRYDTVLKTTELVSVRLDGLDSGSSYSDTPSISSDGRYVAFRSGASNLTADSVGYHSDIFVRDMQQDVTKLISSSAADPTAGGDSNSYTPVISADGSTVAFYSYASNLSGNDTSSLPDVFARRLSESFVRLVSLSTSGQSGNNSSRNPTISDDGNTIAFQSDATDLVANDTNNQPDIFVHSLDQNSVSLVSSLQSGEQGNNRSYVPIISADGSTVVFRSDANNFASNDNGRTKIFAKDLVSGNLQLVNVSLNGEPSSENAYQPSLSANGKRISFHSYANDLVSGDNNSSLDVFVRDINEQTTTLVSQKTDGSAGRSDSRASSISGDGRLITFLSHSPSASLEEYSPNRNVFLHDTSTGLTSLVSNALNGSINNYTDRATISANGNVVAFSSYASNLVNNDHNNTQDVFFSRVADEDFGDAPAAYPVTFASNGARHVTVGPRLGDLRDGEPDATASNNADGDDLDASESDEDAVNFGPIVAGTTSSLTVNVQDAPAGAKLDAWIDFDGNGNWTDANDRIANNLLVHDGDNTISFSVPANAHTSSATFARFRLSTTGGLSPTGAANDGEVEDHPLQIIGDPVLTIAGTPSVLEGDSGKTRHIINVTRSHNYTTASVDFATSDGTAQAGDDYVASAGTLSFGVGGPLSLPIPIEVFGDTTLESNETLNITLSNPTDASLDATNPFTFEITNDDVARLKLSTEAAEKDEGNGTGTTQYVVTVELVDAVEDGLAVDLVTEDGDATLADNDYVAVNQTLTFSGVAGQVQNVTVESNRDNVKEEDEPFFVRLQNLIPTTVDASNVTLENNPLPFAIINDDMIDPVADAGGTYAIVTGNGVNLDASETFDADGISLYQWDLDDDGQFDDATGEAPHISATQLASLGLTNGIHLIRLMVTDTTGATGTDSTTLEISPNIPPITEANGPYTLAGPMRELVLNSDGTFDPDGMDFVIMLQWDLNNDGVFGDVEAAHGEMKTVSLFELQAFGFDAPGVYPISLKAIDEAGGVGFDSTTITITNSPPDVSPLDLGLIADPTTGLSANAFAFDPDDDPFNLTYNWDLDGDGDHSDHVDITEFLSVPYSVLVDYGFSDGGIFPISVEVRDPFGGVGSASGTYEVIANQAPIAQLDGPYALDTPMRDVMMDAIASSDPDGNSFDLAFAWDLDSDGLFDDSDLLSVALTANELIALGIDSPGVYPISLQVTDIYGKSDTTTTTLTITNLPPDAPIVMVPPGPINPGDLVPLMADAMDIDDDIGLLTFQWDLDNDGQFDDGDGSFLDLNHGTLVQLGLDVGVFPISVRVQDPWGGSAVGTADIEMTENLLPIAMPGGPYQLEPLTRDLMLSAFGSSDPDGDDLLLIYEWDIDNDGEYDDANGDLPSIPFPELPTFGIDKPGSFPIKLRVTDIHGAQGFATTRVDVTNEAPDVVAGGPYSLIPGVGGGDLILMASGSDPDDDPISLTYEWDLNGDNVFGDAVGDAPIVPYETVQAFGVVLPENEIRVRVTDAFGAIDIDTATVTVDYPAPIVVTSTLDVIDPTNDATELTLREAITIANNNLGPDTIALPAGNFLLTLAGAGEDLNNTGDLDILDPVVITGAGAGQTVIDASQITDRVLEIALDQSVFMKGVSIVGGNLPVNDPNGVDDVGGGIFNRGNLTLVASEVRDNSAIWGNGGGIESRGSLELDRTVVKNNAAGTGGGVSVSGLFGPAIFRMRDSAIANNIARVHGGGLSTSYVTSEITGTTISGNITTDPHPYAFLSDFFGGGGIFSESDAASPMSIASSTIANNTSATSGGGIKLNFPIEIKSSILAENEASVDKDFDSLGTTVVSLGNNRFGIADTTAISLTPFDASGTAANPLDVGLLPLADNGGDTLTHLLSPSSIAIDAGQTSTSLYDQRGPGFPRILGFLPDAGAVESGDDDGISSAVEDAAPNNGDGNQDGLLDSTQLNVASLLNAGDGNYITIESSGDTVLSQVVAQPIPDQAPVGVDLDLGIVDFTIREVELGGAVTATFFVDPGTTVDTYYKYGPTPDNLTPHWYEFLYDAVSETGAIINGSQITVHLKDGGRGDDDLTANGVIVDPGIPAFDQLPTIESLTGLDVADVNDVIQFSADVSDPSNALGPQIEWDFGDGSPVVLDELFPLHSYSSAGIYTVTLKVTDNLGRVVTESIEVTIFDGAPVDFGDAPAPYPTTLANDGARHTPVGPRLGPSRDSEVAAIESAAADGDDNSGEDDEDGVMFGGIQAGASMAAVNILLENAATARIDAWIDFDRNGTWDATEKILDSVVISNPVETHNYVLPAGIIPGDNFARVRISSTGGLSPTGAAPDGEVEDYLVSILPPPVVESVVINGGDDHRSSIDTVRVTFDRVVDLAGDPFEFKNTGSGEVVTDIPEIDHQSGKTIVDFTFDPNGLSVTDFGSLDDGIYELSVNASLVTYFGVELDGDGNGTAGDPYVFGDNAEIDKFFRKYGDHNGNDVVDLLDFAAFRQTFGKSLNDSGYLDGLDSDGDNTIGLLDFAKFRQNFGT